MFSSLLLQPASKASKTFRAWCQGWIWGYVEEKDVLAMLPEDSSPWKGLLYQAKHTSSQIWFWETGSYSIARGVSLLCESVSLQDIPGHVGVDDSVYPQWRLLTVSILLNMAFIYVVIKCKGILDTMLLYLPLLLTSVNRKAHKSLWQFEKTAGCNCYVSMLLWSWIKSRS